MSGGGGGGVLFGGYRGGGGNWGSDVFSLGTQTRSNNNATLTNSGSSWLT